MTTKYVDKFILDEEEILIKDSRLNPLLNKKYLFIGDSYMTGYQNDGQGTYVTGFVQRIINNLGINATIIDGNGYGFLGMNNNTTWYSLVMNNLPQNPEEYTDIIILGGMNDTSASILDTAINTLMTYLHATFTNAKIYVGQVGRYCYTNNDNIRRIIGTTKRYIDNAYINKYSYIAFSECIMQRSNYFASDGIHANNEGQEALARYIGNWLLNGNIDIIDTPQLATLSNPNNYDLSRFEMWSSQNTNTVALNVHGRITFNTPISIANNNYIDLGVISNSCVKQDASHSQISIPIMAYVYSTDIYQSSNFVRLDGILKITADGKVRIMVCRVLENGGILNLTNVTELTLMWSPYSAQCMALAV